MPTNIAYYLKYRPQTLDELIGQEAVKKTLSSSFQNNKLSHAYLFVGPRGTGKTSLARILAKMVNCERSTVYGLPSSAVVGSRKSEDIKIPCNKCSTCISITDGSNMDLIEIDAASNRGIEDIRSLRDKIKLAPTSARKKVYIIDEVHMLTPEAFNALLKTLEEPPKHALFILATTEVSKIPPTILSRVQQLDFKLATQDQLLEVLRQIANKEKIDIDEQALKFLVKKSDGSFRDAVKLLDQISSFEGKITADSLAQNLKTPQFDDVLLLIKNLSQHDTKVALITVSKLGENGVDIREFILSVMDTLRNLAFIKNGLGEELVKTHFTEDKYAQLQTFSEALSSQDLVKNLNVLQNSLEKLKFASIPSLPLELAVLEICGTADQQIRESADQHISEPASQPSNESDTLTHRPADTPILSETPTRLPDVQVSSDSADILKLKEKWTFVLETIRPYNFSLEALLRSINIIQCTDTKVYMEVPYSFHQRILEAPKNKDLLEGILSDILGRSIQVSTVLGNRPQRQEDIANIEVAQDDEIIRVAAEIFNSDTVN